MTNSMYSVRQSNRGVVIAALSLSSLFALYLAANFDWRQSVLFLVGLAAGTILYHASFGFTAAWREVVNTGNGAGLRAQRRWSQGANDHARANRFYIHAVNRLG